MRQALFVYGSLISTARMARHAPGAVDGGGARLFGHRFLINRAGYATVVPAPAARVEGVLWSVTPRDLAALDAYEEVASGLYRRVRAAVTTASGRRLSAWIYLAAETRPGAARPGYLEDILAAGRRRGLPASYIAALGRSRYFSPKYARRSASFSCISATEPAKPMRPPSRV